MRMKDEDPGHARILDAWTPPEGAGAPVGCVATTFAFDAEFFESECLARFLGLESDAGNDPLEFVIEQEYRMAQLEAAVALVDWRHCTGRRSLRWDLLPVRLRGRLQHAKISLLFWAHRYRLIVASANLTRPGYRTNLEVFGIVDYHEGSAAPLALLNGTAAFVERLIENGVANHQGSPAVDRAVSLLRWTRRVPAGWGRPPEEPDRQTIRVFPVLAGLGNLCVLDQLKQLWPAATPPSEAWVVSPFFDESRTGEETNRAAECLWQTLLHKGAAQAAFCVSAEPNEGAPGYRLRAPKSLTRSIPPRRPAASTSFHRVIDKENRNLHAKAIWLNGDRCALYMIGSSNFTVRGLNVAGDGNVEANLAYVADYGRNQREASRMESCFPRTEPVDESTATWRPESLEKDEGGVEVPLLPLAFGQAVYDASIPPLGCLRLSFTCEPPGGWVVFSEDGGEVFAHAGWEERGRPDMAALAWTTERPPCGLWVAWAESEQRAWWPVEVLSAGDLPPLEELRELPLDVLIRVLTSAQPLHRTLAAEIRRRGGSRRDLDADDALADPHRKVDVSAFLLQRSRRVCEAIAALAERMAKPAPNQACLTWRINGPVGVKALSAALGREAKSREEMAFLLTELAIALTRIKPAVVPGSVDAPQVRQYLLDAARRIRADIPSDGLQHVPGLATYVQRCFQEMAL